MPSSSPHSNANRLPGRPDTVIRDGVPFSPGHDDLYYSASDGLAESRHVFLDGNAIGARVAGGATHLTIAETGFGTGLNLVALMAEMARHPDLHVDYVSIEASPLDAEMMRACHASFAGVEAHADELRRALPPLWAGYHLVRLAGGRLTLHLHYTAAGAILPVLDFRADAWFLDGFAPSRNPDMWSDDLLMHIGRLTAAGGTAASFTSAGAVRRGLEAAGFEVERRPGFARKREMIVATKVRDAGAGPRTGKVGSQRRANQNAGVLSAGASRQAPVVAVVGAGIAGASVAAGLARRGAAPILLDAAQRPGAGASGNRLALQAPRLSIDHNAAARLSVACLSYAARLADSCGASVAKGVLATDSERLAERHDILRGQRWPQSLLTSDLSALSGGLLPGFDAGILYGSARVVRPDILLDHLVGGIQMRGGFELVGITYAGGGVRLQPKDGEALDCDAAVLCAGAGLPALLHPRREEGVRAGTGPIEAPFQITSGQATWLRETKASRRLGPGVSYGGYLTPALDGMHDLGATFTRLEHWRDEMETPNAAAIARGHAHNLGLLPPATRACLDETQSGIAGARTSLRASLPDRNALVGTVAPGLHVFGGLGARGFVQAPLLGEVLAAQIMGRPVPVEAAQMQTIDVWRYLGAGR